MKRKERIFVKLKCEGDHDGKIFLDLAALKKYTSENQIATWEHELYDLYEKEKKNGD
ncbi:MAG: hypothetical protein UT24_C0011G0047 [Candidatus Woesebacteria bacterium GW2011_GWB1_39_12]|uniref:Uncharacterized protein n=1 Tax=Candidatus Woesebacteria bacterium GW2011_GWB1_39_12 TaxID=1618574 RepID=A0A0G0M921_9BACT|nr:MAG: hypothetical protein UT24_C0011G0047 [Candidatus Woesebacteria bacterium GW2011_GWB1_39_12]